MHEKSDAPDPADGQAKVSGFSREFAALRRMIEQLPEPLRTVLIDQWKVTASAAMHFMDNLMAHNRQIQMLAEQANLDHKYLTFDLEATRRERDALKDGS